VANDLLRQIGVLHQGANDAFASCGSINAGATQTPRESGTPFEGDGVPVRRLQAVPDGSRPMPLTLFIQSWIRLRVLASFAFENGWF
jgi:hypothetical protein